MAKKSGGDGIKKSSGRQMRGQQKFVKVKTAKRRTASSTRWLQRQLNDPYVAEAKKQGLRSRAAFKIIQLDEELDLFHPGMRVVDLGAAPGGWTQVAVQKIKPEETGGRIVGIDYLEMEDMPGATFLQADFNDHDAPDKLKEALDGKADLVMSDMAAPTTGHKQTDHLKIMALVELAYHFAKEVLEQDGIFLAKVFQGGAENTLLADLKRDFKKVKHIKPNASRSDSSEIYVVAIGYRG